VLRPAMLQMQHETLHATVTAGQKRRQILKSAAVSGTFSAWCEPTSKLSIDTHIEENPLSHSIPVPSPEPKQAYPDGEYLLREALWPKPGAGQCQYLAMQANCNLL